MTILVVDDDQDQLYVRRLLLEKNGFRVLSASDGPSALRTAFTEPLGCALIDLHLPAEKDGLALIRELKGAFPDLRILLFTGKSFKRLPQSAEMLLVDEIVEKGLGSSELIRKLWRA